MLHLKLVNKEKFEQALAKRQLLTCSKETPGDGSYESRCWYKGTISADDLRRIWVVCTTWTEGTWLADSDARKMTIGFAEKKWKDHPGGDDYDRIERMAKVYQNNPSDECRWAILKDDTRSGMDGFVIDDGNHRAIASVLAGCVDIPAWVGVHPEHESWLT